MSASEENSGVIYDRNEYAGLVKRVVLDVMGWHLMYREVDESQIK